MIEIKFTEEEMFKMHSELCRMLIQLKTFENFFFTLPVLTADKFPDMIRKNELIIKNMKKSIFDLGDLISKHSKPGNLF